MSARLAAPAGLALLVLLGAAACPRRAPSVAAAVSVPYEIDTLDPHARNRLSNFAVLSHLYEPLVTTDASMTIRPCLSTRWDNPDLVTWVFHLRPGVVFHDGSPLTAADVVATFERLLREPGLEMSGYALNVAGVRALDPLTVELRTGSPMGILLNKIRFVLITPRGLPPLATRAVGTGPYALARYDRGTSLELVRNGRYWGGRPALERVTLRLGRSPEQAVQDLETGRSQLVQASSRPLEERLRARGDVVVHRQSSIFVKYLTFDVARDVTPRVPGPRNPFKDRRVREAVRLAVDRQALAARLSTAAVPVAQLVPPFIFGFDPTLPDPPHDLVLARSRLAEAGYPDGFDVTLHARRLMAESAAIIKEMLGEAGIRVTVEALPDEAFFRVLQSGESSFHLSRFGCPTGDASDTLDNAIHTREPARHFGDSNVGGYSNPRLDRLIEESAGILEMGRRRPVLHQCMKEILDDVVWVPLYVDQDVYAVARGFTWQPRNDNFVLAAEIGLAK